MNTQLFLPLLLLPYWAMATAWTDVEFLPSTAEAQARATQEGKLYFVHFTASWCVPCQWMEENIFVDDAVSTFVKDHYLAVKMDFDDANSANYKKRYQVTSLPSLLVFNAKGELIDQYKTSLSKDELLQILEKNYPRATRTRKVESNGASAIKTTYNAGSKIHRPALVPDETKVAVKPPVVMESPANASPKTPVPQAVIEIPIVAKFTIQVGVYSDPANAERVRTRMEQRFSQPVKIVENWQNGKNLYKVMLGKFEQKEAADHFLERLSAQSVPGFVKIIDN